MPSPFVSRKYKLILAVLGGLTAIVVGFQRSEISAHEYRTIRNAFNLGSPAFRAAVADAISNGKINRWEFRTLEQAALDDSRPLNISSGYASIGEERIILSAMAKQVHH
jgi:hypothetical protein